MADLRFPREERLKSRSSIALLFNRTSKGAAHDGLRLVWTASPEPLVRGVQVLVAAPKKQFKQATVRNRVKRLLRESWRLERGDLPMKWLEAGTPKIIGLIYTGAANPTLVGMRASLRGLLDKAKW